MAEAWRSDFCGGEDVEDCAVKGVEALAEDEAVEGRGLKNDDANRAFNGFDD